MNTKEELVETFKEEGPITVETVTVHKAEHEKHPHKEEKTMSTAKAIIIGSIILAISHVAYGFITKDTSTTPLQAFKGRSVDATDLATGNTKSDVVIVEYSDTECPFCAQLQPTIAQIEKEYASKVSFVYRYFPLTQIHPNAFEEAQAIYCVGKLGGAEKKNAYINSLFTEKMNKQNMKLAPGKKESIAATLGIQAEELKQCVASQEASETVTSSIQDGVAAGVQGTPSTFILVKKSKGYEVVSMVDGARPYDYFKAAIEEALAR